MARMKYILAVQHGGQNLQFVFMSKHDRAMALHDMSEAGLVDDYAMTQTNKRTCPECEIYALAYKRNQRLKDGAANYYACTVCGAEIRIKKPR